MKNIYTLSILLLYSFSLFSEEVPDTKGTDFWLAFMPNYHQFGLTQAVSDSLHIFITCEQGATGNLIYYDRYHNIHSQSFSIPNNGGVKKFSLFWQNFEIEGFILNQEFNANYQNTTTIKQTFHITTDKEVSVYALNKAYTTSDAAIIFPTDVLGTNYIVASLNANEMQAEVGYSYHTPSQITVIATENNTKISFSLNEKAYAEWLTDFDIHLNKGEAYLLQTDYKNDGVFRDFTGSFIKSNKPIAVFAGHQRALTPNYLNGILVSRDHLFSQLPPINTFGKTYIITPFPKPLNETNFGSDFFRIISPYDNTIIKVNGNNVAIINAGEFYEAPIRDAIQIECSNECLAVQYKKTSSDIYGGFNKIADPLMLIVPPVKQFLTEYDTYNVQTQYTNFNYLYNSYIEQYVTIISPSKYIKYIKIDGFSVNQQLFKPIYGGCYSYARINMYDGLHKLTGSKPFGVYVFGYGYADSYGYTGGILFNTEEEILPSISDDVSICKGDTALIKVIDFEEVIWFISDGIVISHNAEVEVSPNETTVYYAEILDEFGCVHTDSVTVIILKGPDIDAGEKQDICEGNSAQLSASGGKKYIWEKDSTLSCTNCQNPIATPINKTTYYVTGFDEYACSNLDSVVVGFYPKPDADAGRDTSVCEGGSVMLSASGGEYYIWDSASTLSCTECQNPIANPDTITTYYVTVYDENNCSNRDSVTVDFFPNPIADAGRDTSVCEGGIVMLSASGGEYYIWDSASTLSCTECQNPIASPDTITTYYVTVYSENDCTNRDSVTVDFFPDYELKIDYDNSVCINDTSFIKISGGVKYQWYPSTNLDCDSCAEFSAIIYNDIKYYVLAINENGCEKLDSIFIEKADCGLQCNDVVFPLDIYCIEDSKSTELINIGEQELLIHDIFLTGKDKDYFSIDYNKVLPSELSANKKVKIYVVFHPDTTSLYQTKSFYNAQINITSSLADTLKANIYAETEVAIIYSDIDILGTALLGEKILVEVGIKSNDWKTIFTNEMQININYILEDFKITKNDISIADAIVDKYNYIPSEIFNYTTDKNTWELAINSKELINYDGHYFNITPMFLFNNANEYEIIVDGNILSRKYCTKFIGDTANISNYYCMDSLRNLVQGKDEFEILMNRNIFSDQIFFEVSLPFSMQYEIRIFDIRGKETLIYSDEQTGEIHKHIFNNNFSVGIYLLEIKSGTLISRKHFYIVR